METGPEKVNEGVKNTKKSKMYHCFVCNKESSDRQVPLMSETTYSRISLGKKLQEIIGNKLEILFGAKDTVCWECAMEINSCDKFQSRVDIIKDNVSTSMTKKYSTTTFHVSQQSQKRDLVERMVIQPDLTEFDEENYQSEKRQRVQREYKERPVTSSLSHNNQVGRGRKPVNKVKENATIQCSICLHSFPKSPMFENHIKLHNIDKNRSFGCKLCDFFSTNLDQYCRHDCSHEVQYIYCERCTKSFGFLIISDEDIICPTCSKGEKEGVNSADDSNKQDAPPQSQPQPQPTTYESLAESIINNTDGEELAEEYSDDPTIHLLVTENADGTTQLEQTESAEQEQIQANIKLEPEERMELVASDEILKHLSTDYASKLLKCTNCEEVVGATQLTSHRCYLELEEVEFTEVENALEIDMGLTYLQQFNEEGYVQDENSQLENDENNEYFEPKWVCKTCLQQFPSSEQLRDHWQMTGHSREAATVNLDIKTTTERDNEKSFKVVKQVFAMNAQFPVQNVIESDYANESIYNIKNMFVKVRPKNNCETCGKLFENDAAVEEHMANECFTCLHCSITFLSNSLLKRHQECTGHWKTIRKEKLIKD